MYYDFDNNIQSNLVITRSSGGIFWDRGISEARYRFCRQGFFFLILYIFFDCKLLYLLCTLPRCTFTTHYTMSIVYLFVSVLLLYQSVIKIDVPNKWASACVQPAIADGRLQYWLNKQPHIVAKYIKDKAICSQKIYTR